MRIGELAHRVGVSTDVLRIWERRYDLFHPTRSDGGYRLYTGADERRARRVLALRQRGVPLAAAVARVVGGSHPPLADLIPLGIPTAGELIDRIDVAVRAFDAVALSHALDEAVDLLGLSAGLSEVVTGYLCLLGDQWSAGTVGIAHEHFASHLIRRRISDLLRLQPADGRPTAVLACPPGEQHDIGLLVFGVLLSHQGWCVRFLGADTPLGAVDSACHALDPSLVVISASRPSVLLARAGAIRRLAARWPVAIAGPGADLALAVQLNTALLPDDVALAPDAADAMVTARRGRLAGAGAEAGAS